MHALRTLLVALAVALLAASCASDSRVAATVGDTDITVDDVDSILRLAIGDEVVVEDLALDSGEVTGALNVLVLIEAVKDDAAEFGVQAPALDDEDADFIETYNDFLEGIATSLVPDMSAEQRQAEIDIFMQAATLEPPVCSSHLLVESQADAVAALARIEAGEAFADVATAVSIDEGSAVQGGYLGCTDPSVYVPEFAEALVALEVGQVSAPVESQFGFHVIMREDAADAVAEREANLLAQAEASVDNFMFSQRQAALSGWISERLDAADVTVDPAFGSWVDGAVRPPA